MGIPSLVTKSKIGKIVKFDDCARSYCARWWSHPRYEKLNKELELLKYSGKNNTTKISTKCDILKMFFFWIYNSNMGRFRDQVSYEDVSRKKL